MAVKNTKKPLPGARQIYGGSCTGCTIVDNVGDNSAYQALGAESAGVERSNLRLTLQRCSYFTGTQPSGRIN